MIYKYTSIKRVIAKVFSDLDLHEETHRINDMIEWAAEALEAIGAFPYFVNKVTGKDNVPLLELANYQVQLPADFHNLIQVSYATSENGPFYAMRYGTGSFDYASTTTETPTLEQTPTDNDIVTLTMELYHISYEQALFLLNDDPSKRELISYLWVEKTSGNLKNLNVNTLDLTYVCTEGYIKANVKDGYLMIAYEAVPTDEDGYPMVPDNRSFLEALYWYIVSKLYYPMYVSDKIRRDVYYDAKRSWNYYCKQAYGEAMMPNQDQMESIKNLWLRVIPEINEHNNFFSTLGQQQIIYNKANR